MEIMYSLIWWRKHMKSHHATKNEKKLEIDKACKFVISKMMKLHTLIIIKAKTVQSV